MTVFRIARFAAELKRRRVFRVTTAYLIVAWLLIQVATTITPELGLPAWTPRLLFYLLLAGLPLAVVLAWAFDLTPDGIERTPEPVSGDAAPAEPLAEDRRSIAVLPFVNMSADADNEYFSDGITEELLNVLAQSPELRVAARTSSFAFKGRDMPIQEIGRALFVSHLLEGSVRKAGDRVRITAQLIAAKDGYHLWSETYDRELRDIFAVQGEIARMIAGVLHVRLGLANGRAQSAIDPQVHTLYLRGRHSFATGTREGLEQAIRLYGSALEREPRFAPAHAAIAEAYGWLADGYMSPQEAMPHIERHARRAIELDDRLADGHAALGMLQSQWGWDFDEADRALGRALELNPSHAMARLCLGMLLVMKHDFDGAVREIRESVRLDPLSPIGSYFLELTYLYMDDADAALAQHDRTEEIHAGFIYHDSVVAEAYRAKGRYEEAIAAFKAGEEALGRPSAWLAALHAGMGNRAEAERSLRRLEEALAAGAFILPESMARVHAALGDDDAAFRWLAIGLDTRSAFATVPRLSPELRPLLDSDRYLALVREKAPSLAELVERRSPVPTLHTREGPSSPGRDSLFVHQDTGSPMSRRV